MSRDRLERLMNENRLTTASLAERLGVSDRQVRRWLDGSSQPNSRLIKELAIELKSSADFLLELSDDPLQFSSAPSELSRREWSILSALRRGDERGAMRIIING